MLRKSVVENIIKNQREIIKEMQRSLEAPLQIILEHMNNAGTQTLPSNVNDHLIRVQSDIIKETADAAQRSLAAPLQMVNGLTGDDNYAWGDRSHRPHGNRDQIQGPFQYPQLLPPQ